tara:strand:+ start:1111 stop:1233 length:123 start_codon:yes stop_codon:yes gene_type:complete
MVIINFNMFIIFYLAAMNSISIKQSFAVANNDTGTIVLVG